MIMKMKSICSYLKGLLLLASCFSATSAYSQYDWKPKYMGEIHAGYATTSKVDGHDLYTGRVMLGTTHGVAFGKYGDLGIGVNAIMLTHYYSGEGLRFAANPYFSVRPAWPFSEDFAVFLDCALGATIPVANMEGGKTDFTYQLGPGIRYKRLNISLGMQTVGSGKGSTTFFAKLGLYLNK